MTSSTVQCMQRDGYSTVLLSSLSVIKQKVHCAADLRRALVPVLVLFKNEIVQSVLLKLSRYSTWYCRPRAVTYDKDTSHRNYNLTS